jgi:FkbM family methyltransferase
MTMPKKAAKLLRILGNRIWASAMVRHGVAAAVEHVDAIRACNAATLIDIGANKGQFSLAFHALRKDARVIAFEPLPTEADRFEQVFAGDPAISLHRVALSDKGGDVTFHVTDRPDSSSLLPPGDGQSAAFGVNAKEKITVPVRRLDKALILDQLPKPILVKIDVQGAELQVLKGMSDLNPIDHIYVELSFVELYTGQPSFSAVAGYLFDRGFEPRGFFNQVVTKQFGATQVDVLFSRRSP